MKDEQITVSKPGQPANLQTYSRQKFYNEQFSTSQSKPNLAVHVVDVLVFTPQAELILQKRSFDKRHNTGLIDKSIGGHISYGDNPDYTVMLESVQELLTPSFVLKNEADFRKTHNLLKPYLNTIALMQSADVKEIELEKVVGKDTFSVNNVVHLYFGVYNGRVRPADREAAGVLYYQLQSLREEMAHRPDLFTHDLKIILTQYSQEIDNFLDIIRSE